MTDTKATPLDLDALLAHLDEQSPPDSLTGQRMLLESDFNTLIAAARRLETLESALSYLSELQSPYYEEQLRFRIVRDWRMPGEDVMHVSAGVVISLAAQNGWDPKSAKGGK